MKKLPAMVVLLKNFNAYARQLQSLTKSDDPIAIPIQPRLIKGPAYDSSTSDACKKKATGRLTVRMQCAMDSMHLGITGKLQQQWLSTHHTSITAPVIVGDSIFLAEQDTHTVLALDSANGMERWRNTFAGALMEAIPTAKLSCWENHTLQIQRDGWVHMC